jgi:pimeloyl-ACP methyl ester carboxylesterase
MPYATNGEVRINYRTEGHGPPLVLQHGFTGSIDDWYDMGYVDDLKDEHRLILVDSRGHGASDKPHDPAAYHDRLLAADVVAVLDDLDIPKSHFLGYSLGGRIGLALGVYAPERFSSLVLGGISPYARIPARKAADRRRISIWEQGSEAYAASLEPMGPGFDRYKTRALAGDFEAFIAMSRSHSLWGDLTGPLHSSRVPMLIFVGDLDDQHPGAQKAAEQIAEASFVSLPGLDHFAALSSSDLVLPRIKEFVRSHS